MKRLTVSLFFLVATLGALARVICSTWNRRATEVLPDPHRSVKREGELQHEQFAYIARVKRQQ